MTYRVVGDALKLFNIDSFVTTGSGFNLVPSEELQNVERDYMVDTLLDDLHLSRRFMESSGLNQLNVFIEVLFGDLDLFSIWLKLDLGAI